MNGELKLIVNKIKEGESSKYEIKFISIFLGEQHNKVNGEKWGKKWEWNWGQRQSNNDNH